MPPRWSCSSEPSSRRSGPACPATTPRSPARSARSAGAPERSSCHDTAAHQGELMPDYAIVNLLEIDDSVGGRVEGLEGRFGRTALGSRDLGVSHWRYAPGTRTAGGHSHREQEEAYVVVTGSAGVRWDAEVPDIRCWDVVRVAPEVVRGFEAAPDWLELIAVGGPKPEG